MRIDINDIQTTFQQSDMAVRHSILDALVEVFRPSDYQHLNKVLDSDCFVGDIIQILPAEILIIIFGYLESRDVFLLRNVSMKWNSFLSESSFMNRMTSIMFAPGICNPAETQNLEMLATFEDKVRCLCAIRNGTPYSLEFLTGMASYNLFTTYCSGTLLCSQGPDIIVNNLYTSKCSKLHGDYMESFVLMEVNMHHILAASIFGMVYCWNVVSLKPLAKFRIPSVDVAVRSSATTILLNDQQRWYIYSLTSRKLFVQLATNRSVGSDDPATYRIYVDGGLVYAVGSDGILLIDRLNALGTSLSAIKEIDVRSEVERICVAKGQDISMTGSACIRIIFGHDCIWDSETDDPPEHEPNELQYVCYLELRDGDLKFLYHKTMQNYLHDCSIYYPMLSRSFTSSSCYDDELHVMLSQKPEQGHNIHPSGKLATGRRSLRPIAMPERAHSRDQAGDWKHFGITLKGCPDLYPLRNGCAVLGDFHFQIVHDPEIGTVSVFRFYEDHMLTDTNIRKL